MMSTMLISKKKLPLLIGLVCSSLLVVGYAIRLPRVTVEMTDNFGVLIQEEEKSELTRNEIKLSYFLNEKDWINAASVILEYLDEGNRIVSAILIVDSEELEYRKDEIVSIVTNNALISDVDIEKILILDMEGNEVS